ncbi:MAG: hypothetical protein D6696_16705, partial [Acidobacteria bacterium]
MSDSHEPSYYEIALTNRQVMVAFVALLLCLLAAFVGGVWLGREGWDPTPGGPAPAVQAEGPASPTDLEGLEEFKFYSDAQPEAEADRPLAEDVGSAPAGSTAAPPPPRTSPPPPPP